MKRKLPLLLCVCFSLIASSVYSQIFRFTIVKKDVTCNETKLGEAKVVMTSSNGPFTYLWSTGQTTNQINDLGLGYYTLSITDAIGRDTTTTVGIFIDECQPNPSILFSPNDDGINDVWDVANWQFFPDALIIVYNRLGQKVFEHKGLYDENSKWNGKDKLGIPLPDATYYYVILEDKSDKSKVVKGNVNILR